MDDKVDGPRDVAADAPDKGAARGAAPLRQSLTAWRLVLLVVAAAAPMAAVVGLVPVGFALGNGAGLPFTVLVVSLVLGLFSVGYSAMSRRVVSTGAFYTYVTRGLGGVLGLGAAFMALISYTVMTCGGIAYFAYFSQALFDEFFGWAPSWMWFAAAGSLLIAVLGYRGIDMSFRVVAVLVFAEIALLLCLVAGIIGKVGVRAFPGDSFSFHSLASGAPGVAVMLVFGLFAGFESAALYSEETRDPRRSVARATYGAVVAMGGFYILTTWVTVGAVGSGKIVGAAAQATGTLYFDLTASYLAPWASQLMSVFMATSMFATVLAAHNVASRYFFALGRQRCLPGTVGRVHSRYGSPHRASIVVSIVTAAIVIAGFLSGMAPMVGLGTITAGLGVVGIMALQCLASLAVIGYFRRHGGGSPWSTVVAPLLAFLAMGFGLTLAISRFDLLSGASNGFVNSLPVLIAMVFVSGSAYGWWLKIRRKDHYERVTAHLATEENS